MRSWERALCVLEALRERGQAAGHGWALDTGILPPHQQQVNALESHGLVELAGREDHAELSVLEGRPVRWAARLTPYGHDTLTYGQSRAEPPPGEAAPDRQAGGADPVAGGGLTGVCRPHQPAPGAAG
ncbi:MULTISPECIES: hypothetical protein [unclassified Streptomyces]|uniref:hypothetical protein n=1 Tax=unclassified Streptomyces TaxID=2593676 RepID=UPI002B1CB8D2|nr:MULTISPECIES: hypothetical protein [unclassified Streptomyces]